MSKRRMVGWQPLAVENTDAPAQKPSAAVEAESFTPEPVVSSPAAEPQVAQPAAEAPAAAQPAAPVQEDAPVQEANVQRRRMAGWQPLAVANTAAPVVGSAPAPAASAPAPESEPVAEAPAAAPVTSEVATAPAGPIQDPAVPRRRMAGWQPLLVAHDAPTAPVTAPAAARPEPTTTETAPAPVEPAAAASAAAPQAAPAPVTEDLPRRRMDGWRPLQVGHPATVAAPAPEATLESAVEPAAEPAAASAAPRRMGAPAEQPVAATTSQSAPKRMGAPAAATPPAAEPQVKMPEVVTPPPAAKQSAATSEPVESKRGLSKPAKVVLSLLGVAIVAAGLVLVAQWLRTLDPVAQFIATYDGTPTHPEGVEAGIPAWVGWQHFFNFFIIVMVIRSGLLIRNQERPEAYWTPNAGGFYSPNKDNTPAKVSIQQWIHQSFNVLWVINGLIFYVMVFATGHWMRIVPTNWDIFPNMVSAGLQYLSLDWPAENSWVYYNALQIMTYFITVFIAAPIAVLTGLRLSTWWPQNADKLNKAFPLPVARSIHFITMLYFVLFIIVHLFLVFTTGVLTNLNMMFAARDSGDWIGLAVFAVSVAFTVGVAWLIKPIFISPIAEKTGTVSTR